MHASPQESLIDSWYSVKCLCNVLCPRVNSWPLAVVARAAAKGLRIDTVAVGVALEPGKCPLHVTLHARHVGLRDQAIRTSITGLAAPAWRCLRLALVGRIQ